jgi:hypothetical protein
VKTLTNVGLIIALIISALSFTATASVDTPVKKAKVKRHLSQKHRSKGKKKVSKKSVKKDSRNETAKLSTDINFNDSVLHGRYQTPDEADAKVENEKSLADLLAVRTQFKDRLKKSSEQN